MAITSATYTEISQLYVALFGRAPDAEGLGYWAQLRGGGAALSDLANTMFLTEPARLYYPNGLSHREVIASFYLNVLGRPADAEGLDFWSAKLDAAGATVGSVITEMIHVVAGYTGSHPDGLVSQALFNNRVEVAGYWSAHAGGVEGSGAILADVSADPATVEAAKAAIGSDTFILTTGADHASANIFNAGLVYDSGTGEQLNTLQDEDILTGTGSNPTLNATLNDIFGEGSDGHYGVLPLVITPTLVGIETVNLAVTGAERADATLDLQNANGLKAVSITSIGEGIRNVKVGNIQNALESMSVSSFPHLEYTSAQLCYVAGALAGENRGTLNLDGASMYRLGIGRDTFLETGHVSLESYEHLTINVESASSIGFLDLPMDSGSAGSIIITGTADLELGRVDYQAKIKEQIVYSGGIQQTGGHLASIDASALTGNLTLVLNNIMDVDKAGSSGVQQDVTVIGGSGDDIFSLYDVMQAGDRIIGGEGTDTLLFYSGSGINPVAESIEVAGLQGNSYDGAVVVDFSGLTSVTRIEVSNITHRDVIGTWGMAFDAPPVDFTMTNLSAVQAAGITIQHAFSGGCGIADSVIQAALATDTASDTLGVTIADGKNTEPRFNFTIDTAFASSGASSFEHLSITDTDAESNVVELEDFAQFTGSITLKGGKAGTFLNFDVDTDGADVTGQLAAGQTDAMPNIPGYLPSESPYYPVQQGLLGLSTDGTDIDFAAGHIHDVGNLATQVRLGAASINAAATDSDVIVRVGTNAASSEGAQRITMGSGNDTVIFDLLNDTRAGLSGADTVAGGAGADTLVIDGDGARISLGASEWSNVTGFETLRLVGNGSTAAGTMMGQNSYNLTLTNALITANGSGMLVIINDNDSSNDAANGMNTEGTGVESAVTIDARILDAQHHFSYNGEEGASATTDRFIFSDTSLNGLNIIDGGAADNFTTTWGANADVLELRNSASVSVGDLAQLRNIGTLAGSNDQTVAQSLSLELNDSVVDALVDSYHSASATEQEVLTVRLNAAADISGPVAGMGLNLDASALTQKSIVQVALDAVVGAADVIELGMGRVQVSHFTAGTDKIQLSVSTLGLALDADDVGGVTGANAGANGTHLRFGATAAGAASDKLIFDSVSQAGSTSIYYDADGNGAGQAVLIGTVDATLAAADVVLVA